MSATGFSGQSGKATNRGADGQGPPRQMGAKRSILRAAGLILMIAMFLSATTGSADAAKPKLKKAGLTCQKSKQGTICLLFVKAKGPRQTLRVKPGKARWSRAGYWGRGIFAIALGDHNPVGGTKCVTVRARIGRPPKQDAAKVRLCEAGIVGTDVPYDSAAYYAHWERFR